MIQWKIPHEFVVNTTMEAPFHNVLEDIIIGSTAFKITEYNISEMAKMAILKLFNI